LRAAILGVAFQLFRPSRRKRALNSVANIVIEKGLGMTIDREHQLSRVREEAEIARCATSPEVRDRHWRLAMALAEELEAEEFAAAE
jgi:hypothetical protein